MNSKSSSIIISLTLGTALSVFTNVCNAQSTQKLTATKATDYGLIYNLPDVAIDVYLEAKHTEKTPGEFANYAVRYLKSQPVISKEESWELVSATLVPKPVVNPDERYAVKFKNGSTVYMLLSQNGAPLSVNTEIVPEASTGITVPKSQASQPSILELPIAKQAQTQEMLQSTSVAKRAELAANRIFELRQQRNDIISGNADGMPTDGAAMKLALDNISAQEEALTAMFMGTVKTSTEVKVLEYIPGTEDQKAILARLSQIDGIVSSDNLSGAPIYINYKVNKRGELPVTDKGEPRTFPKGGLAYRIPGEATVSVDYNKTQYAKDSFMIPALGAIYGLDPASFSDKKTPAYAKFDMLTGALIETGVKPASEQ